LTRAFRVTIACGSVADHNSALAGENALGTNLSAREVQEAIEERISKGLFARGERLPPVRSIAVELGTSPSTVSRALIEMVRGGWLEVQERRFVRVRSELPPKSVRTADLQRTIKSVAHKWKLWGGDEKDLIDTIRELVHDVFNSEIQFVFTECNTEDLNFMADQVVHEITSVPLNRLLIDDLNVQKLRDNRAVVLVPYYHYAEVKERVGEEIPVVPVHSTPSVETLDQLLTVPPGAKILIVGHNKRSVARLSGLVRDYTEDAKLIGITLDDREKMPKLVADADVVFAVRVAAEAVAKMQGVKRLIPVRFVLEGSLRQKLIAAENQRVA
jgi:DNA-binding transcriptional regulator YhcF (GntR family)